jgi:rubredoxin
MLEHQRTGLPVETIIHELVHLIQGVKMQYTGNPLTCRICHAGKVYVTHTERDSTTIDRSHECSICGWIFHTIEQIDPADPRRKAAGKIPDPTTTPPPPKHTQDVGKKKPRKKRK